MSKGRNTTTIAFRVPDAVYAKLRDKAQKKGMSVGEYIRWIMLLPYQDIVKAL